MVMKQNGKTFPADVYGAGAVHEWRERGHLQVGQHEQNAAGQRDKSCRAS